MNFLGQPIQNLQISSAEGISVQGVLLCNFHTEEKHNVTTGGCWSKKTVCLVYSPGQLGMVSYFPDAHLELS